MGVVDGQLVAIYGEYVLLKHSWGALMLVLGRQDRLRKAALQIAARPPTLAEQQKAQQGGLAALDPLLSAMMDEPAFAARVREIFNDLLLTDANLYEQSADGVIANGIETKRFLLDLEARHVPHEFQLRARR